MRPTMQRLAVVVIFLSHAAFTVAADTPPFVPTLTADYLSGDWAAVESSLKVHAKEIDKLPASAKADATAIAAALSECHPAWWQLCKAGKKMPFHPMVWNRRMDADFEPGNVGCKYNNTDGSAHFELGWDVGDMDSTARGEHGFTKGEIAELGIWMTMGSADAWTMVPISAMENATDASKTALTRYIDFRSCVTGAYYGSPRSRRWAIFLYLNTYLPKYNKMSTQMSREAVGALFINELLANPGKYPSIQVPATLPGDRAPGEHMEQSYALVLKNWIEKHPWTLPEDIALREAIKQFAVANSAAVVKTGSVKLPNKLLVALDPDKDKPLALKRDAWITSRLQKAD